MLDREYLARLGQFDVVYSWGVLHHTGAMWQALENVARLVVGGGLSLWQREILCNELRWFFYNPFCFLKRRLITLVFISICTRRSQENDGLLRELLHDSSSP